ncbi:MAG: hypothetical protein H6R26_497 [Proteobacteria bacterium]|nr:hypothetical protein [Pseudomonadota bacterium]
MLDVCFVLSGFPVLSETFVTQQIVGLLERGFDVSIVRDCAPSRRLVDFDAEPFRTLLTKTKPHWIAERWVRPVIDTLPHGIVRSGANAVVDIVSDIRLNGYDVLIAHFGGNGRRLARSKAFGALHRPFLTFFHGYDISIPFHAKEMDKYRRLISSGETLLPACGYFRDILLGAGAQPDSVRVHHTGVDIASIRFEPHPLPSDGLKFLSVGRLVEKKGTEYAVKALGLLRDRRPDLSWTYDVIASGMLISPLRQLVKDLDLEQRVRFLGPQPHEHVVGYLRQADVLLHPCVTAENGDMEACPVVLQEAMAAGLLVVSTSHSGIPELIESGKSGFLVPERDAEALGRQVEDIVDHPDRCKSIRREARAVVERHFNQARLNDALAELIIETAARHPRA